jgi:hypothetical protein
MHYFHQLRNTIQPSIVNFKILFLRIEKFSYRCCEVLPLSLYIRIYYWANFAAHDPKMHLPGKILVGKRPLGVLFLDELPEFGTRVLEVMSQPMEDKVVTISRAKGSLP